MDVYVTLRLFLFGLLAFVPDYEDGRMTVLLLDARHPPHATDGCPIHAHRPMLFFKAQECDEQCRSSYGLCGCEFNREQICLRDELEYEAERDGYRFDKGHGYRFSKEMDAVAKMRKIKSKLGKFDQDCLAEKYLCRNAPSPNPREVCKVVAARVSLRPRREPVACRKAGKFVFHPLTHRRPWWPLFAWDQDLTDIMMVEVLLQTKQGKPILDIVSFNQTESFPLQLPQGEGCGTLDKPCQYDLVLANVPEPHVQRGYGRCSGTREQVARDFELFHDLVDDPLRLYRRPVPRRVEEEKQQVAQSPPLDQQCTSDVLDTFLNSILRTVTTRDICPPAQMSGGG